MIGMLPFGLIVKRTLRGSYLLYNFQRADSELAQKIDLSLSLLLSDDIILVMLASYWKEVYLSC